jgi:hypothetical protein
MNTTIEKSIRRPLIALGSNLLFTGLLIPTPSSAYQIDGISWPTPTTTFYVDIGGANGLWNEAFETAMFRWSDSTPFDYRIVRGTFEHPCNGSNRNGVGFTSDVCGDPYGSTTLAVTLTRFIGDEITETDIVFNDNQSWDVYSGPWESGGWSGVSDFRRVAVHELGHALGLNHEDSVPAIMATNAVFGDSIEYPTSDDIAGVNALYIGGGVVPPPSSSDCSTRVQIQPNDSIAGTLAAGDCTINELDPTSGDPSYVDLYDITMPVSGNLTIRMDSTAIDSFVLLFDPTLNTLIDLDDDSGGNLNSLLTVNLAAGDYTILANSAFADFAQTGPYTLTTSCSDCIISLAASVLPTSRSVQVNNIATAFATIINTDTATATGCSIAPLTFVPGSFFYQTTDPATNALSGTPDTPVDISAGGFQTFVFGFTPTSPLSPTDVQLSFDCADSNPAQVITGVNTLLLSASSTPVPDIVALAATIANDGIVHLPGPSGAGAFAVATVNVGVSGTITVSPDTGTASLPLALSICETNPGTGACLGAPASSVTTSIAAGATPTFAIFTAATGNVPFDPANNRIFVRFVDAGAITRGATSVAVTTQ